MAKLRAVAVAASALLGPDWVLPTKGRIGGRKGGEKGWREVEVEKRRLRGLVGAVMRRQEEEKREEEREAAAAVARQRTRLTSFWGKDNEEEDEEDEEVLYRTMGGGRGGGRRRKRRLRSRNAIVDKWLVDEEGDDAYADLEDFIMPDEYT